MNIFEKIYYHIASKWFKAEFIILEIKDLGETKFKTIRVRKDKNGIKYITNPRYREYLHGMEKCSACHGDEECSHE